MLNSYTCRYHLKYCTYGLSHDDDYATKAYYTLICKHGMNHVHFNM